MSPCPRFRACPRNRRALVVALLCACTTMPQPAPTPEPKSEKPAALPDPEEKPKTAEAPASPTGAVAGEKRPLHELPYTPSLDPAAIDRSVDPCVDFYQFACGGWMKSNPIPADQPRWSVYGKLADENQRFLWGMLWRRRTAARRDADAAEDRRLLRRLHGRGGDREGRRRAARRSFAAIDALQSIAELAALLGAPAPRAAGERAASSASAPTRTSATPRR